MTDLKKYDKYITIIEGMDYRTAASELENVGVHLKHATIRNIVERTMPTFLDNFLENMGIDKDKVNGPEVLKTVQFYDNLIEIVGKTVMENPELVTETVKEIKTGKHV
jgi:hypothetical protein